MFVPRIHRPGEHAPVPAAHLPRRARV